jgi:hypothetical protein
VPMSSLSGIWSGNSGNIGLSPSRLRVNSTALDAHVSLTATTFQASFH